MELVAWQDHADFSWTVNEVGHDGEILDTHGPFSTQAEVETWASAYPGVPLTFEMAPQTREETAPVVSTEAAPAEPPAMDAVIEVPAAEAAPEADVPDGDDG